MPRCAPRRSSGSFRLRLARLAVGVEAGEQGVQPNLELALEVADADDAGGLRELGRKVGREGAGEREQRLEPASVVERYERLWGPLRYFDRLVRPARIVLTLMPGSDRTSSSQKAGSIHSFRENSRVWSAQKGELGFSDCE